MVRLAMPAFAPESMSLKTVRTRPHIVSQVPSKVTIREWRRFRRDYKNAEVDKEVGVLKRKRGGVTETLVIVLDTALWFGRSAKCEVVLDSPYVSDFHLRVFAVRTSTHLSIVCLHDISSNGYILNGRLQHPKTVAVIGEKTVNRRMVVLRDGDTLQLPGSENVYTYLHNTAIHGGDQQCYLFHSPDNTSASIAFYNWKIYNYPLGNGTFGYVNVCEHIQGGLQAACKTIYSRADPDWRYKFKLEVEVMKKVDHPNVLRVLDQIRAKRKRAISDDDADGNDSDGPDQVPGPECHLVLELVTGGDLFSYFEKSDGLSEDETRWFAWQMILGLEYLHKSGIAHRDIKPENLLLHTRSPFPRLIIADFGHSTTIDHIRLNVPSSIVAQSQARHYETIGTYNYLPPERLKAYLGRQKRLNGLGESLHGAKRRDALTQRWFEEEVQLDVWAMGVVLFTGIAKEHPYDREARKSTASEHQATASPHFDHPTKRQSHRSCKMGPEPPISFFQSSQSRELNTVQQSQISTQESMTSDTFTKYDEQNTSSSQAWRDPSQPPSNIRDDSQSRSQSQMLAAEVDDAVHLDNDGHEDNKAADTDDDTGTHYSSLSGAASWAKFREEVGGRTIGSSLATDQGHEIMNLYDDIREFVRLPTDQWEPTTEWRDVSNNGIDFCRRILTIHPVKRLTIAQAKSHPWITAHQLVLNEFYQNVVIKGMVPLPI